VSDACGPPGGRTALWDPVTAAAAEGRFVLQVCTQCGALQYPPREICRACLASTLEWREVDPHGAVLAVTTLHVSNEPWFASRTPWSIAAVKLDAGVKVIAHVSADAAHGGARVRIRNIRDASGQAVFVALPEDADGDRDAVLQAIRGAV
jgi:uncharacterized OB-fold protein